MIPTLMNSLRDVAKERIKNPIFGAFFISWILINWNMTLLILFSDKNIEATITILQSQSYVKTIILPITFSFLCVAVSPWIGYGLQLLRNKAELVSKKYKFAHENDILKEKAKMIETEAKNESLKEDIRIETELKRKEMELEIKEREFDLEDKRNKSKIEQGYSEITGEKNKLNEMKIDLERKTKEIDNRESKIRENGPEVERLSRRLKEVQRFEGNLEENKIILGEKDYEISRLKEKLGLVVEQAGERLSEKLELKRTEIEGLKKKNRDELKASIEKMEGVIQGSFVLLKNTCNLIRNSVIDIHEKKGKYVEKIYSAKTKEELEAIRECYIEDYQKLFCTPAMELVDIVKREMILFLDRVYGVEDDFRVIIKLVHEKKGEIDRNKWEFSNSIWDSSTWTNHISSYLELENNRCKIGDNSAISSLTTGSNHYFICNDLLMNKNLVTYKSHNKNWKNVYNAKILTKIENRNKRVLYGFLSIDTMNHHKKELFCEDVMSIPFNIAFYASEALSVLIGEVESYHDELSLVYNDRVGSIIYQNRRIGDLK